MRKTRLRAALLLVVAAALGGIGYLVSRDVIARRGRGLEALGKEFLPQVAQRIRNFRRVKMEKGRTVWEIRAAEAQYFDQDDQIVVVQPRVTFFLKDEGRTAHLAGAEGRISLDGHDVKMITLRGEVVIRLDDLELGTDEATYDRGRDLITAPGAVTLRGRTLDVQALGMEVDVTPQHVRLLKDVRTTVHGNANVS